MKNKKNKDIFNVINFIILLFVALIVLIPLLYILAASFSSATAVAQGRVSIIPADFTVDAYKKVFSNSGILTGYLNTFFYTIVGTLISMVLSICGAYPLSSKKFLPKKAILIFVTVTMWLGVGTIPIYLNLKSMHLLNSRLGVLVPFAINTFNVLLLKSAFESIPGAIEEAATIDGANKLQILIKIFLPLMVPTLLTITLYYAVERWNGYFWSMIIIKDQSAQPLQVVLASMITQMSSRSDAGFDVSTDMSQQTFIYATIVVSVVPMVIIYPFIQRFFVKGIMLGAVKG